MTKRPYPDQAALGIRAGAFLNKSELKLGLEYNDNIYAAHALLTLRLDVLRESSLDALGA